MPANASPLQFDHDESASSSEEPRPQVREDGYLPVERWVPVKVSMNEFSRHPERYLGNIAKVWDVTGPSLKIISRVPTHLIVISAHYQVQCAGTYKLAIKPREFVPAICNKYPYWIQQLTLADKNRGFKPKVLFMVPIQNRWAIADSTDDLLFHLCASTEEAELPTKAGAWASNEPEGWVVDMDISVEISDSKPAAEGADLLYLQIEHLVPFDESLHAASAAAVATPRYEPEEDTRAAAAARAEEEEAAAAAAAADGGRGLLSTTLLPGMPRADVRTRFHLNQRVAVKDRKDTRWLLGTVVEIKDNVPLVKPDGHLIVWKKRYLWDDVVSVSRPPDGEWGQPRAMLSSEYLAPDDQGRYFTCRVVRVSDDGRTCDVHLTRDGQVWGDVPVANLLDKGSLRAEFARWRGHADDALLKEREAQQKVLVDFEYRLGDKVEVRDSDAETWAAGRVVGFSDHVISAALAHETGRVQRREMYAPLVALDQWAETGRSYRWKQVRKHPLQQYVSPTPGAKRALIIAVSYRESAPTRRGAAAAARDSGAVQAAYHLAMTLEEVRFNGELRMVTDSKNSRRQPTREGILKALGWLREGAACGDSLFLAFVGRSRVASEDRIGVQTGLYPVDFRKNGIITDDELYHSFFKLVPEGVKLTCLFDTSPPTSVLALPQAVTGESAGLTWHSPEAAGCPRPALKCMLSIVSLTKESVVDVTAGQSFCGILTDTFCACLQAEREPTVNELVFRLSADLADVHLKPMYASNAFVKTGARAGIMSKQFYLGTYPVFRRDFPPLAVRVVEVRACGSKDAAGSYMLHDKLVKGQSDLGQDAGAYTNYLTKSPCWKKIDDPLYEIRWYSGCWWILKDVYGDLVYLYKTRGPHPFPPFETREWEVAQGEGPLPLLQARWGGSAAARPASGDEVLAVLTAPVTCGVQRYQTGEEVWAAATSAEMFTIRTADGGVVQYVHTSKLKMTPKQSSIEIGDVVAARDSTDDEWLLGRVVKLSRESRRPYVRPENNATIPWERPGGYLFKYVERVEIGVAFEGKDETGKWFPVSLTADNRDGTFQAEVTDDNGDVKIWDRVHPQNIRRPKTAEATGQALRKQVTRWREQYNDGQPVTVAPDYGFDTSVLSVGQKVRVRDSLTEPFLDGTVVDFTKEGYPLVTPESWSRGPYVWRILEMLDQEVVAAEKAAAEAAAEAEAEAPWPEHLAQALRVETPHHLQSCRKRRVRAVRFTPTRLMGKSDKVILGCLQLLASPEYELPNPPLYKAKEYTGGVPSDIRHGPENAGMISYGWWECGMPASVVFQLKDPSLLYGYRLQTPAERSNLDGDPAAWKVEVADGSDSGWVLWDEVDTGLNEFAHLVLPEDPLAWSEARRPESPWHDGVSSFTHPCSLSEKCNRVRALTGRYTLEGKQGDGVRGQPVYAKTDRSAFIHLSAHNCWTISFTEEDMKKSTGVALVRSADTSQLCYKGVPWDIYSIGEDNRPQWVMDHMISVAPVITKEAI